jgi:hypothetical protein
MVAQARPVSDRSSWWRRRSGPGSGGSPDAPSGGSGGCSPGSSPGAGHGLNPDANHGNSPGAPPGAGQDFGHGADQGNSPGGSPGRSDGAIHVQVLGDSTFVTDIDGRMGLSPKAYAEGLIKFLQEDYEELRGQYVTTQALEKRFYPQFLKWSGWPRMPWRTVVIALGRLDGELTHKREREYRCARGRGGKWGRRSVTQFLVPAPAGSTE